MIALVGAMFVSLGSVSADNHSVTVTTSDSDDIVMPGINTSVSVMVKFSQHSADDPGETPDVTKVTLGGPGPLQITGAIGSPSAYNNGGPGTTWTSEVTVGAIAVPSGTPMGEYTIEVAADVDGTGDEPAGVYKGTLTVGEAGDAVDGLELTAPDGESAVHNSPIKVDYQVKNSLGSNANNGDVTTLLIEAIGADTISHTKVGGDGGTVARANFLTVEFADNNTNQAKGSFTVTKTRQGVVDVKVTARGTSSSGAATIELSFTGNPETITVEGPSGPLADSDGEITFDVAAVDGAGTSVNFDGTGLVPTVKDSSNPSVKGTYQKGDKDRDTCPDGLKDDNDQLVTNAQGCTGENNGDDAMMSGTDTGYTETHDKKTVQVVVGTSATTAKAGEYTLVLRFKGKTYEAPFSVSGPAKTVTATSDVDGPVEIGDQVTVTAEVKDKDGIAVKNGVTVTFTAVGALELRGSKNEISLEATTMNGSAMAKYFVVKGDGVALVTVNVDDADGDRVRFNTAAPEPEAMPEEEASVACLSNLNGFATWACGVESSASEIFGLVSGRGATALHLWNGSAWVRYSVVDGTMVPGSSDFMVAENDILYISN